MTFIKLLLVALALVLATPSTASAADHVRTGAENGKPNFGNSDPFCVPGEGDPKSGTEQGTPAAGDTSCRRNPQR